MGSTIYCGDGLRDAPKSSQISHISAFFGAKNLMTGGGPLA